MVLLGPPRVKIGFDSPVDPGLGCKPNMFCLQIERVDANHTKRDHKCVQDRDSFFDCCNQLMKCDPNKNFTQAPDDFQNIQAV